MKALVAVGLLMLFATGAAQAKTTIVVVGDLPYNSGQEHELNRHIAPLIAELSPAAVIHLGDIRGGSEFSCRDFFIAGRRDAIERLLPGRVIFTPGDNDWTDCDRSDLDPAMSELESLDQLADLFLGQNGIDMDGFDMLSPPEASVFNRHWRINDVHFLTLHVVGTNNGRVEVEKDALADALERVEERDARNITWLQNAAQVAVDRDAAALVVAMHADITDPESATPCSAEVPDECDAYQVYRDQLEQAAQVFDGPMLLIHGDTWPYCLDRDFGGESATNLWRFNSAETTGSLTLSALI